MLATMTGRKKGGREGEWDKAKHSRPALDIVVHKSGLWVYAGHHDRYDEKEGEEEGGGGGRKGNKQQEPLCCTAFQIATATYLPLPSSLPPSYTQAT